jgi:hypothetical protein
MTYADDSSVYPNKVSTTSSTIVHKKSCGWVISVGLFLTHLIVSGFIAD